jgi:hypothetical protein
MDASGHPEIFIPLFLMTAVWLGLMAYLIRHLRQAHPGEYERLGKPDFQQGAFRLLGYVFVRGHSKLGDAKLSRLCDFMAFWFVAVQSLALFLVHTVITTPVSG